MAGAGVQRPGVGGSLMGYRVEGWRLGLWLSLGVEGSSCRSDSSCCLQEVDAQREKVGKVLGHKPPHMDHGGRHRYTLGNH